MWLRGKKWMDHWREDNLKSFFNTVKDHDAARRPEEPARWPTMSTSWRTCLRANEFPMGTGELTAEGLEGVQVIAKDGPQPVPDFALVTVVGCLSEEPAGTWRIKTASEPVRTRNPRESTPQEDAAAAAKSPGAGAFKLLDTRNFRKRRWRAAGSKRRAS